MSNVRAFSPKGGRMEYHQLLFVVSDGLMDDEGRQRIEYWVRKGMQRGQLIVLIIIDCGDSSNPSHHMKHDGKDGGILETKRVKYSLNEKTGQRILQGIIPYLED